MRWVESHRAERSARLIADRHYNRQKPGTKQFVPPGRCLVFRTPDCSALWVTSWPFARYVKHDWPGAWICSAFRRESWSADLASDLIREAVAATLAEWPEPPTQGMVSFIDPRKVKPVMRRGRLVYGLTWIKAGFRLLDVKTKGGLLVVQMEPADMPQPVPARQEMPLFDGLAS